MAKAGRKRKITTQGRMPSGRLAMADRGGGELAEQVRAVVISQRERRYGATAANANDQRWSSPIGVMRMWAIRSRDADGLSDTQERALTRYALVRARHRAAQGYPADNPRSISDVMVAGGGISGAEVDDEEAIRRAAEYNSAKSALLGFASAGVQFVQVCELLAKDRPEAISEIASIMGTARQAANVLVHHWGMA
jgi:hypothetical protein